MAKKLFVGNLAHSITTEELKEIFAKHGTVDYVKVIEDRETGRSRGFGFVEFSNEAEANDAIKELNDQEFSGRKIVVNEANDRRDSSPRRFGGNGGFNSRGGNGHNRNGNGGFGGGNRRSY